MNEVKRYDLKHTEWGACIGEKENGKYVEYADLDALRDKLAAKDGLLAAAISEIGILERRAESAEAALREREGGAKDAARYRWLRNDSDEKLCVREQGDNPVHRHLWAYYITSGERLDAAIDAAIQAQDSP